MGYFAADLFFCGKGNPQRAIKFLETALQAKQVQYREFKRGFELEESEIPDSISEETLATLAETGIRA